MNLMVRDKENRSTPISPSVNKKNKKINLFIIYLFIYLYYILLYLYYHGFFSFIFILYIKHSLTTLCLSVSPPGVDFMASYHGGAPPRGAVVDDYILIQPEH